MRYAAKTYGFILACLFAVSAYGQQAEALIDRNEIRIGEQAVIKLSVRFDKNNPPDVSFPLIGDTLVKGVEVVRKTGADTLSTGASVRETRIEQQLFITSFDSGYYAIPPFEFTINGQPSRTEAFLLTVKTVEVDTTKGIVDIREIYEVQVSWLDYVHVYWPYAAGGLALLAVAAAVIILISRYRKKQKARPDQEPEAPKLPPHVVARQNLERIRTEKIYTSGKVKDYHTSITDTLRTYLEDAYGIHAHELTSGQIMDKLRYSGIGENEMRTLRTILFRADMVKFAKEKPDETDNAEAVNQALQFVEATKVVPEQDSNIEKPAEA